MTHFDLSHGFLPANDPLLALPPQFSRWESAAHEIPKLLITDDPRQLFNALPKFDTSQLGNNDEYERAMLILSYIAHAYVWWNAKPIDSIPVNIAQPWVTVANKLGRPPVLSYASYALYNWYRIDKTKPIKLGNIALAQNFLGGADEEWFILIHVDIEARAIPALTSIIPCLTASAERNQETLTKHLGIIKSSLSAMNTTLERIPEFCDPYIYYNRVRPYIHGWKDNPALPIGLIYTGVDTTPKKYKGETGAQSSIIPCLDALFGVKHADNPLKAHLEEMKLYMPPLHREFIAHIENKSDLREVVRMLKDPKITTLYNDCIKEIARFRKTHINYAAHYIQKQKQTSLANATTVGTGGTPFMQYLQNHVTETEAHTL